MVTLYLVILYTIDKCLKRYATDRHPHRFFPEGPFLGLNQRMYTELYLDVVNKSFTPAFQLLVKDFTTADTSIDKMACKDVAERNTGTLWVMEVDV